jgi:succinate dehydrogenase / fumarate reductase cytochrome b subunit
MQWIVKYLTSSIGKKQIMGCTGALLAAFVFGHMVGNIQLLNPDPAAAQASYNSYCQLLTGYKPFIYGVELVMICAAALHIFLAVTLKIENKIARGSIGYDVNARKGTKSFASFTMIWTGLIIAAFLVWHLMTLKFGEYYLYSNPDVWDGKIVRDMWLTTIMAFSKPWLAALYVIAMFVLGMHLFHAIASAFQTLGIAHQKWTPIIEKFGLVYSVVVALGFAILAAGAFYLSGKPETQALIEKSRALQPQYEQQKAKADAEKKASFVIPSVGEVQVSLNAEF